MQEDFPVNSLHEQRRAAMQPMLEYELHNQQLTIDVHDRPLVSRDEALAAFGVNGDILATITLPGEEESREVAIVDYGEPDTANPRPVSVFEGQPVPMMGVARERYGLRGLNYSPDNHMATHVGFSDGATIQLGRDNSDRAGNHDANYKLGLTEDNRDTQLISRKHATITLIDGKLTIADHSTNHSTLRIANPERTESAETQKAVHEGLGRDALEGAGVELEQVDETQAVMSDILRGADMLQSGTFEPSIVVGNMNNLIAKLPESDPLRAELAQLIGGVVDKYGRTGNPGSAGVTARQIKALINKAREQ